MRVAEGMGRAGLKVLQVAAEAVPLVKTGGLADVVGALPDALARTGIHSRLLLPGFAAVKAAFTGARVVASLPCPWNGPAPQLMAGRLKPFADAPAYMVVAPDLYERPGGPYSDPSGAAWADNHRRFAPLAWAARALARGADRAWQPDVVHAHDWHAGLAPAALSHAGHNVASVMTIHNLAYQGLFPAQAFLELDLPAAAWNVDGVEFWGQVSFMKAGLHHAQAISTVSPTYAREILDPAMGCGLDGVLRAHPGGVAGILNGVDYRVWHPATDPLIPHRFDARQLEGKALCKAALQQAHGLHVRPEAMLMAVVSRLTSQKGLDLQLQALPCALDHGAQLVVLGQGDPELEAGFAAAARRHPGSLVLLRAHDEALAHQLFAAADVVLVPSRFEPCGLTQLYAMAYGALPLVHHVGGLADTVQDATLEALEEDQATGFVFHRFEPSDLQAALRRAHLLWRRPEQWFQVQQRAMAQRFDWDRAAQGYAALYERAMSRLANNAAPA